MEVHRACFHFRQVSSSETKAKILEFAYIHFFNNLINRLFNNNINIKNLLPHHLLSIL